MVEIDTCLVIVLVASEDRSAENIRTLARISRLIRRAEIREDLLANRDVGERSGLCG
jgi:mannitol/fructose-specific phosphotransferase system IIA component (Ntr-type)